MITSSKFFKKTFFDLDLDTSIQALIKKNPNANQINKTVMNRYSQLGHVQQKKSQKRSNTKNMQKDINTFSKTKNRLNQNYNQIQQQTQRKNPINQLDQFTIDVTPWNQNSSLTSRELYDTKLNLSKEREKIKSTISKYKFARTIEQYEKRHANFIKSPKKSQQVNYILYEYNNKKSKEGARKGINLIKNVDLNKSYEQYLNYEIDFDKDFLFRSHAKVKTHNKQEVASNNKRSSREGKNRSLIEHLNQKEFMDDTIKKDLVCSRYKDELRQKRLDTSVSNLSGKEEEGLGQGGKVSERKKILEKGKILKYEMNRRIFKGTKISLNGMGPLTNGQSKTQRQKCSLQVSGNKTRKLQYSFATD